MEKSLTNEASILSNHWFQKGSFKNHFKWNLVRWNSKNLFQSSSFQSIYGWDLYLHGEGVLLSRFRQLGWNWLCCLDGGFYTPFAGIFKRTNSGLSNNTLLLYKGPIHRPTVYSYFTFSTIAKNYLLLCKASRFSQDYGLKP